MTSEKVTMPKRNALSSIDIETNIPSERRKLILALTWPALAENLLASLVSMADTIMVSSLGTYAMSAVGLVTQPRFIMLSAFMALGVGTTALVARARGQRDPEQANNALVQSLILSVVFILILCAVMLIFLEPLIRFIAGSDLAEQTIQAGIDYFRIQLYGFPLLGLTFTMNAALRGVGNTRAGFYSNTAANLVNICFNYCLINGHLGFPALGVAGASIATVIGQGVAFVFCLYLLLNGKQYIRLRPREIKVDLKMMKRIGRVGFPAVGEQVAMRVGNLLFTMIATSLGDVQYAAHIAAMNVQQLAWNVGMSFGTASTTLTGQSLGRNRPDLARAYMLTAQKIALGVSLVITVLFIVGGRFICSWYSSDAQIIALASQMLLIIALANPLSNGRFIYTAALRGAGDAKFSAILTLVGIMLLRPIVSIVMINFFHTGLTGLWISLVSDAVVGFLLASLRWRGGKWASIQV